MVRPNLAPFLYLELNIETCRLMVRNEFPEMKISTPGTKFSGWESGNVKGQCFTENQKPQLQLIILLGFIVLSVLVLITDTGLQTSDKL